MQGRISSSYVQGFPKLDTYVNIRRGDIREDWNPNMYVPLTLRHGYRLIYNNINATLGRLCIEQFGRCAQNCKDGLRVAN